MITLEINRKQFLKNSSNQSLRHKYVQFDWLQRSVRKQPTDVAVLKNFW